jgi:hypothetical protein
MYRLKPDQSIHCNAMHMHLSIYLLHASPFVGDLPRALPLTNCMSLSPSRSIHT